MVFPLKVMVYQAHGDGSHGSHDGGQSAVHPVRPGDDSEVGSGRAGMESAWDRYG